jgi:hypothetical protein
MRSCQGPFATFACTTSACTTSGVHLETVFRTGGAAHPDKTSKKKTDRRDANKLCELP